MTGESSLEFMSSLSKNEKRILAAVGLIGLIVLLILANDDLLSRFRQTSTEPEVGRIVFVKNDTRHKDINSVAWNNAKTSEIVRRGDSVFSGQKSSAQVELKKGGVIEIGENSLIVFREMGGDIVGNIDIGSFRIKSEGTVKVAVGGRITTIEGTQSDIEIVVGKNKKPQVSLISGHAKIKQGNSNAVQLVERTVASLEEPLVEAKPVEAPPQIPEVVEQPQPVISESPKQAAVPSAQAVKDMTPTWHLDDLYLRKGNLITELPQPKFVMISADTPYTDATPDCYVQLSNDLGLSEDLIGDKGTIHFSKLFVGTNSWRTSFDKINWSEIQKFNVTPQFLIPQAEIHAALDTVAFLGEAAKLPIEITAKFETTGFVVQTAKNAEFLEAQNFWSEQSKFNVSFFEPGDFFYRVRAVNTTHELTDWSSPVRFKVFVPEKSAAPLISPAELEVFEGEKVSLNWLQVKQAAQYDVQVSNEEHQVVETYSGQDTQMVYQAGAPGIYSAKLAMIDSYGRKTMSPKRTRIHVQPRPVIEVVKPLAVVKPAPAAPVAVVATQAPKVEAPAESEHYNFLHRSQIQVEGSFATLQSTEQVNEGTDPMTTGRVGVVVRQWWDKNGLQLSYYSDLFSVQGTGSVAKVMEARYLRALNLFDNFSLHFFVFGGVQSYRNSNQAGVSSPGYDLVKLGMTAEAPVFSRSALSAEAAYGLGLGGGTLYELGGRYDYFFKKNWSLGLGFRLHFFNAGNTSQTPLASLPFREGFSESYSLLKYYY